MKCAYGEKGCTAEGTFTIGGTSVYCMPHAALFLWLINGEGDDEERIRAHDEIAALPSDQLEMVLRAPPWDARIKQVLKPAAERPS